MNIESLLLALGMALDIKMDKGDRWVTLKSGKRVLIDKDGNVRAGLKIFVGKNISQLGKQHAQIKTLLREYTTPAVSVKTYVQQALQNAQTIAPKQQLKLAEKAAYQYFKDNLLNTYVETMINGQLEQIHFTKNTLQKFRYCIHICGSNNTPMRMIYLLDCLPNIIQANGIKAVNQKPHHSHSEYTSFERISVLVSDPLGQQQNGIKLHIDIGVLSNNDSNYESYSYAKDVKNDVYTILGRRTGSVSPPNRSTAPKGVSSYSYGHINVSDSNLPKLHEVVNIEIIDNSPVQDVKAMLKRWLKHNPHVLDETERV